MLNRRKLPDKFFPNMYYMLKIRTSGNKGKTVVPKKNIVYRQVKALPMANLLLPINYQQLDVFVSNIKKDI